MVSQRIQSFRANKRLSSQNRHISIVQMIDSAINSIVGAPIDPLTVLVSNAKEVVLLGAKNWAAEGDTISLKPRFGQHTIRVYKSNVQTGVAPIEEIWSIKEAKKTFAGWINDKQAIEAVDINIVWLKP